MRNAPVLAHRLGCRMGERVALLTAGRLGPRGLRAGSGLTAVVIPAGVTTYAWHAILSILNVHLSITTVDNKFHMFGNLSSQQLVFLSIVSISILLLSSRSIAFLISIDITVISTAVPGT